MKSFIKLMLFCFSLNYCSGCFASETVFYALRYSSPDRMSSPADTLASLKNHYQKINILIPQAYVINAAGDVKKGIEPAILEFAKQHAMKIMPLVTNSMFSASVAHQFFQDSAAQAKAIKTLTDLCLANHYYGMQLDFEMISIKDRDALTHFYEAAANALHKHGFAISFAVAPVVTDQPDSLFLKKVYENWEGAYDLKQLGKTADFITIMAYNQHASGTTPGPAASVAWMNQTIKYTLQYVPANKISIGIPDYTSYWYTGAGNGIYANKIKVQSNAINFLHADRIIHKNNVDVKWDKKSGMHYAIFSHHWLNEYLFIEDTKSFDVKYDLVKKYKLRGVSIFDLGTEDARIWNKL